MELRPGILGAEAPINGGPSSISFPFQGLDVSTEISLAGGTFFQTRTGQDAELDLRHVEPTAVLGCVMELQPFYNPSGLRGREGLV